MRKIVIIILALLAFLYFDCSYTHQVCNARRNTFTAKKNNHNNKQVDMTKAGNLKNFLKASRAFIIDAVENSKKLNNTIICTGNESGDLDSFATAISYAYLASGGVADGSYVPIVRTLRPDLHLRTENILALDRSHVDASDLTCPDDFGLLPLEELSRLGAKYVLVDHNKLNTVFGSSWVSDDSVVGILDHHQDELAHTHANPRIIERCGSCSSLVANYFSDHKRVAPDVWNSDVADLLLSAILIDTRLVSQPKGKATNTDFVAAKHLSAYSSIPVAENKAAERGGLWASVESVDQWTSELLKAKDDVDALTVDELLRRDMKEYYLHDKFAYTISSIPRSLADLEVQARYEGSSLRQIMHAFGDEHNLMLVFILTSFKINHKRYREVAMLAHDPTLEQLTIIHLDRLRKPNSTLDIGFAPVIQGSYNFYSWMVRSNTTRKILAPALQEVLTEGFL